MISLKAQYGLRAMVALAKLHGKSTIQARDIAKTQDIPLRYLELLLSQLRRAQLINATRGKNGGYFLTKKPDAISVYDVIMAFEGKVFFMDTRSEDKHPLTAIWKEAEKKMENHFKSLKISNLVSKAKKIDL
ncbi:MAG: Rrf2 family transcriptional regulator [Candidatus Zixiibacteriota bacterium]